MSGSESLNLEDPFWSPLILHLLALVHFALSVILIASHWNLMVSFTLAVHMVNYTLDILQLMLAPLDRCCNEC